LEEIKRFKATLKEEVMRLKIARRTFVMISVATLCLTLGPLAQADDSCSTANAAGEWGFTLTGTLILPTGPVPAAAIARGTLDAQGNIVSATEARNVGGDFANETITGSWIVNSDCTGTLTINAYESGKLVRTSVLSMVFVDNLREVLMIQQSLTLPDGTSLPVVINVEAKKVFSDKGNEQ
jgi:hypothetical protein